MSEEIEPPISRQDECRWGWDPTPWIVLDRLDACATWARRGEA